MDTGNKTEPQMIPPEPLEEDELEFWKQYLINRPDNKMAWYLLGKAYDRQGKHGKAKYCYVQAGDIYRAYEKKTILVEDQVEDKLMKEASAAPVSRSEKRRWSGVLLLVVLFVLLSSSGNQMSNWKDATQTEHPSENASWEDELDEHGREQEDLDEGVLSESELEQSTNVEQQSASWTIQMLPADASSEERLRPAVAAVIGQAFEEGSQAIDQFYVVQASTVAAGQRQWMQWVNGVNVLVSIDKVAGSGMTQVQAYDPRLCVCLPPPVSSQMMEAVQEWQRAQEQLLVAMSAAEHYRFQQGNDSMLNDARQLIKDYPQNILPGLTDLMSFQLNTYIRTGQQFDAGRSEQTPAFFPYYVQLPFTNREDMPTHVNQESVYIQPEESRTVHVWNQPLEIIVDTSVHKLAVVSGSVILRNYSVGLGGERTPLGVFEVTEKVRNPNGRDDGDFGSRGMTLSDSLYAIHGTNEPESIGKDESLGCVRMGKEDIEELFDIIPIGTKVTITEGVLPDQDMVPEDRFHLPSEAEETNDTKVYQWL